MVRKLTVVQMLPALESGGVERGTLEIGAELVRQGHRSIVISAGGRLVKQLEREGSEHLAWDVGRKRLSTLRYVRKVRKFLAGNKVDILHLRSRLPAWIGYLAWRGMPHGNRPRLITTVHGPYTVNRYSAVMTKGERVIAVSEMIRDYITSNYAAVDPSGIRVIHRGVDPAEFPRGYRPNAAWLADWYRKFPQTQDVPLVVLPARLTRWKGQEDLLQIMCRLKERNIPAVGVLVGGAHPRRQGFLTELQEQVAKLDLNDHVVFAGHRSDIREVLSIASVVLSLSREPEAFGRTTLEALSLGVPVLGYAHGGVAEQLQVILPEGAIPVGDVEGVAGKLEDWLAHPPVVPAQQPFTLDAMRAKTLGIYEELARAVTPDSGAR